MNVDVEPEKKNKEYQLKEKRRICGECEEE